MLQSSVQLYKNAYSGLSRPMWWLALVMLINRSGTMVIPFLMVYMTKSKGYSLEEAGFVMAAFGLGAILGGFLGGILTDRLGHFYVQFTTLFLNGIMFFVLARMETFWSITTCIFILSSVGEAFRPANSAAIAAYSNESNRTRCYSLNRLAINLGWAIGPALGGFLASIDYSLLFLTDGLTCIGASVLLLFVLAPSKTKHEKKAPVRKVDFAAYRDSTFLFGMFFIFLIGICFFQMFSILPVYYKEQLHLGEKTIGALLAMNGLIIAVVEMVLVYKLENKKEGVLYMTAGAFLIAVSFIMLEISAVLSVALASMIVITFGEMLLFPFMNNFWVRRTTETNRGQYAAVYTMAFSAAILLAPTFASQVASRMGFPMLWVFNFFICSFAGLGFLWLKKRLSYE